MRPAVSGPRAAPLDVERLRRDFPMLGASMRGKPLAYLDNAATSQKPEVVIETMARFYREECANIHRGVYQISENATLAYEEARTTVRRFLNAAEDREIVFVRGATEAVNLVAHSFGRTHVGPDDEILISGMEHHSNLVPWQMLCEERGARLVVVPIQDDGSLRLEDFERLISPRTRLVAVVHVSNSLGTINPVARIAAIARRHGVPILVDGAQAVPHLPVDVQELDCDFYAISGHKVFGPTGIGALYGRAAIMETLPPYQGGGDMIETVTFEKTTYAPLPARFEAGTPNIAGALGMAAAMEYIESVDRSAIAAYEAELAEYATSRLQLVTGLRLIGTAPEKASVLSFVIEGVHPHDIGTLLDREGIAIRAGHHCTQPVMDRFQVPATARASLAFYNTRDEVDRLVAALIRVRELFGDG